MLKVQLPQVTFPVMPGMNQLSDVRHAAIQMSRAVDQFHGKTITRKT
jgi:hypothetical protein